MIKLLVFIIVFAAIGGLIAFNAPKWLVIPFGFLGVIAYVEASKYEERKANAARKAAADAANKAADNVPTV
jgi:uncharacterized membrane protein YjjB (DUF3815 family)